MGDGTSIVNLGELSRPATVLIEKVSEGFAGYFKPFQIKRVANAEAEADRIRAASRIEVSDMEERALARMVAEEGQKQENIEEITRKAIPNLSDAARPEDIERDWLTHFFDRCRLISNDEMQMIWANILAGQANAPGSFSKKTIDLVATLDKADADYFTFLCSFMWDMENLTLTILGEDIQLTSAAPLNFEKLIHMTSMD